MIRNKLKRQIVEIKQTIDSLPNEHSVLNVPTLVESKLDSKIESKIESKIDNLEEKKFKVELKEPDFSYEDSDAVVFVSDQPFSKVKSKFKQLRVMVYPYTHNFNNCSFETLYSKNIKLIWIDLNENGEREWLQSNIDNKYVYNLCIIYGSNSQKFIKQLKNYQDSIIKLQDFLDITCFTTDFISKIKQSKFVISKPHSRVKKTLNFVLDCFLSSPRDR